MKSVNPKLIARRMTCGFAIGFFCLVPLADAQVDCDKEPAGALQRAIDVARPGDTIPVTGTCEENLNLSESRNRITVDGRGKAVVRGADPDQFAISVRGRGIVIRGFTITGGLDGVRIQQGGHAKVDGNTIERNVQFGIIVTEHSSAIIINNTVQYNPRIGIVVNGGSFAHIGVDSIVFSEPIIGPNVIRYNGQGVQIERIASARIATNDVSFNNSYGFRIDSAGQANISSNTIDGNTADGIFVSRGSGGNLGQPTGGGVLMQPNETKIPNQGFGVRCEQGG
jgi:parallel beta-helix repeat protein